MTKLILGGKEYVLEPLVFTTIKKIWPILMGMNTVFAEVMKETGCTLEEAIQHVDPMWQVEQGVKVIGHALAQDHPEFRNPLKPADPGFDWDYEANEVSKRLLGTEVTSLEPVVSDLMKQSGFSHAGPVDSKAGKKPSKEPSTATGIVSSPSSLPQDAKEEAGTQ